MLQGDAGSTSEGGIVIAAKGDGLRSFDFIFLASVHDFERWTTGGVVPSSFNRRKVLDSNCGRDEHCPVGAMMNSAGVGVWLHVAQGRCQPLTFFLVLFWVDVL